jgi:hypothetical protein
MNCTNTEKNNAEVKGVRIRVLNATFNNISVWPVKKNDSFSFP